MLRGLGFRCVMVLATAGLFGACSNAESNKKAGSIGSFPKRSSVGDEGDASPLPRIGRIKAGDGQQLQMDLQRPPAPGTSNLFACWDVPAVGTLLGRAICVDDASRSFDIKAENVTFICRTDTEFGSVLPTVAPILDGCGSFEVFAHRFDPLIELEIADRR